MKKFLVACIAVILSLTVVLSGCSLFRGENGADGKDGKDGQNFSIREVWETYKEETNNPDLSFADFLDIYFSQINVDKSEEISLQAAMNYSLMSGVSISTTYQNTVEGYVENSFTGKFSSIGNVTYHEVYVGSGVIVEMGDTDSYIVTNCHVVYSETADYKICRDVRVYLYGQDTDGVNYDIKSNYVTHGMLQEQVYYECDEDEYGTTIVDTLINTEIKNDKSGISATVVGASLSYDIALLKVKTSDILSKNADAVAAVFDTADDVYIGDKVYAVGFPHGEGMSVTSGRVTKVSEYSDHYYKDVRVFRTDAAINGGNSGGAIYNSVGKIVGIVCSKRVGDSDQNLGYALPASNVRRLWQLMRDTQSSFNINAANPEAKRYYLTAAYAAKDSSTYWNADKNRAEYEEKVVLTDVASVFPLAAGEVITHITIKNGETVIEDKDVTRAYYLDDLLISFRRGYTVYLTTTAHATPVAVTVQDAPYRA